VSEVVMADIDPTVCRVCKDEMQPWHQGAFDDPRFKLVCWRAFKRLARLSGRLMLHQPAKARPLYSLPTSVQLGFTHPPLNEDLVGR
jgi:hypothetical protein